MVHSCIYRCTVHLSTGNLSGGERWASERNQIWNYLKDDQAPKRASCCRHSAAACKACVASHHATQVHKCCRDSNQLGLSAINPRTAPPASYSELLCQACSVRSFKRCWPGIRCRPSRPGILGVWLASAEQDASSSCRPACKCGKKLLLKSCRRATPPSKVLARYRQLLDRCTALFVCLHTCEPLAAQTWCLDNPTSQDCHTA